MKLYEFGPTRSIRARWTLQELEVDFESIKVNLAAGEHLRPEFLAINPAGRIPVLVDGGLVLTESVAIVLYLAEKYPAKGLLPSDPQQRAEMNRWLMFVVTELEQPLWRLTRNARLYPPEKRIPADIALASEEFCKMANVLERHMRGREFVATDKVTVADFVAAYTLDWGGELKLLGDCPTLQAYIERMYARPRAAPRISQALAA